VNYVLHVIIVVRKFCETLTRNGTHYLLAYADDVNILGENTDTIQKNTETLLYAGKEVGFGSEFREN
jgi:hypothetical protein